MAQAGAIQDAFDRLVADIVGILPDLAAGMLFLVVAGVVAKAIMLVVKWGLRRAMPAESPVYRQFIATVVWLFLWFGIALSFLSIIGLELVAASMGTATGFTALGVAYALSGMLEDAVAGVYLLRDPDFNPGDVVTVDDLTAEVASVELRKTRFQVEDGIIVRANAAVEKKWKRHTDDTEAE